MSGKSLAQPATALLLLLATGCATADSRWELVAAGAALADIGSTGAGLSRGGEEANPVYGADPSVAQVLAINAVAYAGTWSLVRRQSPQTQQRVWRSLAVLRLAATAWNLTRAGCFCFRFSF